MTCDYAEQRQSSFDSPPYTYCTKYRREVSDCRGCPENKEQGGENGEHIHL